MNGSILEIDVSFTSSLKRSFEISNGLVILSPILHSPVQSPILHNVKNNTQFYRIHVDRKLLNLHLFYSKFLYLIYSLLNLQ